MKPQQTAALATGIAILIGALVLKLAAGTVPERERAKRLDDAGTGAFTIGVLMLFIFAFS